MLNSLRSLLMPEQIRLIRNYLILLAVSGLCEAGTTLLLISVTQSLMTHAYERLESWMIVLTIADHLPSALLADGAGDGAFRGGSAHGAIPVGTAYGALAIGLVHKGGQWSGFTLCDIRRDGAGQCPITFTASTSFRHRGAASDKWRDDVAGLASRHRGPWRRNRRPRRQFPDQQIDHQGGGAIA